MLLQKVMKKPTLPISKITDIEIAFGRNLKRFFDTTGLSQAAFASKIGIKQPTLNTIFNGKRGSSEKWRREVSGYIGIPYEKMIEIQTIPVHSSTSIRWEAKKVSKTNEKPPPIQINENIIKKFKDQETALNINRMLVDIESAEPEKLKEIEKSIEFILSGLAIKKKENGTDG